MDLELKIRNFGPIDKATVQVGRFTVFAGPNNTGKTLVSKMLYSILGAMNANNALELFGLLASLIESELQRFDQSGRVVEEGSLLAIRRGLQNIDSILRDAFPSHPIQNELDQFRNIQSALMAEIEGITIHYQALKNNLEIKMKEGSDLLSSAQEKLKASIDILENEFKDGKSAIDLGRFYKFSQNIEGNFQVSDISGLEGNGDSPMCFRVQGVGEFWETERSFEVMVSQRIVQKFQPFPGAFYIESPLYWKLKSALESIKLVSNSSFRSLNGVPDYFYDMAVALRRKRIEHPFAGIHESLHSAIGGRISLSATGELEFHEKDQSIPLSLTSAGVANMGMLALLIERGALDQGSFLFIDEPESNLHPAWQVKMAQFLFELARQGVHVVVSIHSMTILKWIEVHVKEKPEDRELVRLNKFPPEAEWNDDMDAVMAEVKQSLTKPFSDLYIQGL